MSDQDHLLDHNYDGIQEYDNPLPAWWVYLFWGTILFSIAYYPYYHFGVGASIEDEYAAEVAAVAAARDAGLQDSDVTEEFIYRKMQDTALMAGYKAKFISKCASCHGNNGGGLACPNMTDDYWLHGGTLMDFYKTIRDGIPGKEMKSWEQELGVGGCANFAAYIGTLRGTNVDGGKAKEGDLVKYTPPELTEPEPADGGTPETPAPEGQ